MAKNSAFILVLSVAGLVTIGMIMLFSVGAYSHDSHGDMYYFLKRQVVWLAIGMAACVTAACVDYHWWERMRWPLFMAAVILLILCFVPHIGLKINGSPRWVRLGPIVFQPSELAKLAAIVALSHWFCRHEKESSQFLRGFIFPLGLMGVLMVLIVKEKDLGTTVLIGATSLAVMFIAGCNAFYIFLMSLGGAGGILVIAMKMPERLARLNAFLDLEKYKEGAGLQQWWALVAFGSGGISGVGLGGSIVKNQYLPYAHTEFIFPIIGEELGLRATLPIVLAFLLMTMCGVLIAMQARDRFGMLLGFGLIISIVLQATVNIGMTTALLPNKGMSMPFISAGGSNLCLCLLFVGILLNIYRQGKPTETGPVTKAERLQARTTPRI
jgi:cell division protein FtsW